MPYVGPSMRRIDLLRPVVDLERLTKAIALLDAILEPEWDYRYYSFNQAWDEAAKQRLASMRNGSGDEWQLVFSPEGAFLKGFAHESSLASESFAPARFVDGLPPTLTRLASEVSLAMETTTFCAWCIDGLHWSRANIDTATPAHEGTDDDPDGSAHLLSILDGNPETYRFYAAEYFEENVPVVAITALYEGKLLTAELLHAIAPHRSLDELAADLDEIGWPRPRVN